MNRRYHAGANEGSGRLDGHGAPRVPDDYSEGMPPSVPIPINLARAGVVERPITLLSFDDRFLAEVRIAWSNGTEEWKIGVVKATCRTAALVVVTPSDKLTREDWFHRGDVRPIIGGV